MYNNSNTINATDINYHVVDEYHESFEAFNPFFLFRKRLNQKMYNIIFALCFIACKYLSLRIKHY